MKKVNQIIWLVYVVLFVSCNSGSKKTNNNQNIENLKNESGKVEQVILSKDSGILEKKPTSQQIYSEIETMLAITAKLKYDPSTLIKHYNHKLGNNLMEISCYFSENRLIRIENRIFNEKEENISFMNFDFDDKNNCISNAIKKDSENESRIYAYINNYVIEYDSKLMPIVLDSSKKQQIIQLTKVSLDSTMQHFPEFKYSFNWK